MQPVQTESSRDLNKASHCSILFAYEIGLYQRMQISDQSPRTTSNTMPACENVLCCVLRNLYVNLLVEPIY